MEFNISFLSCVLAALFLLYWVFLVIYNLHFHPLAKIPGPLWWRLTRLGFIRSFVSGNLVRDLRAFHERHGDIVRTAPNEVSLAREDAWHDALAGRTPLPRNPVFFKAPEGQPDNLVMTVDLAANARMRSVIMPAFTESALAKQEPVVQAYADLLVDKLAERVSAPETPAQGAVVNIVDWLNWFAFDLVGELGFGESFKCLEDTRHHPWVTLIFESIKVMGFAAVTRYYPGLDGLLLRLIPESLRQKQHDHYAFALDKVRRRRASPEKKHDFMSPMLENNPFFERMSLPEIESTMSVLIMAGSETTATTLSGMLNCLVQSPDQLRALEQEIRGTFQAEKEMTLRALQNLPFLNAAISEGLRVCNPVPGGILRIVPRGGAVVCGHFLPEGTYIVVNSTAMSLSETNFRRAGEFLAERFLPEPMRPAEFSDDHRSNQKPFGRGARSCLGKSFALAEMRLVLARLVWKFDISQAPGAPVDWNQLKTYVLVEKKPINVVIKQRAGV